MTTPDNERMLPILEFEELVEIFEYKNERAARRALRLGTFPVPTFELAGRTVAHVDSIDLFFKKKAEEGIEWMEKRYGAAED